VQEPRDFADHRAADSTGVMGPAFMKRICGSDHDPDDRDPSGASLPLPRLGL
jgi:hypothetical protein